MTPNEINSHLDKLPHAYLFATLLIIILNKFDVIYNLIANSNDKDYHLS